MDFFYILYTKMQECKIKFWFLYQKISCPGLQGIKVIFLYFYTTGGQAYVWFCSLLVVYRVPVFFFTFSIQRFKSANPNFGFCTKKLVVEGFRVLKESLCIYVYYRRTGIGVFLFCTGGS